MKHLSTDQVSRSIIGDAAPEEAQHARECSECNSEVTRLRETFAVFRDSVQYWTGQSGALLVPDRAFRWMEKPARTFHWIRWAVVCGVFLLVAVLPVYLNIGSADRRVRAEDALLLEQVNAHLSRAVPAPMEPFMELLSENSPDEIGGRQ